MKMATKVQKHVAKCTAHCTDVDAKYEAQAKNTKQEQEQEQEQEKNEEARSWMWMWMLDVGYWIVDSGIRQKSNQRTLQHSHNNNKKQTAVFSFMSGAPAASQHQTCAYNKHTHEGASQKNNTKKCFSEPPDN